MITTISDFGDFLVRFLRIECHDVRIVIDHRALPQLSIRRQWRVTCHDVMFMIIRRRCDQVVLESALPLLRFELIAGSGPKSCPVAHRVYHSILPMAICKTLRKFLLNYFSCGAVVQRAKHDVGELARIQLPCDFSNWGTCSLALLVVLQARVKLFLLPFVDRPRF